MEDARDLIRAMGQEEKIVDATLDWIRSTTVAGYHGTRLTDAELQSVQAKGLVPLQASARRDRLVRALSGHPRWAQVEHRLDELLENHGPQAKIGVRENQVHLTLSREALVGGFNHYLTHGSEFDQQIARLLLGKEGYDLLAKDGDAVVLAFAVPGPAALEAMHLYLSIEHKRERGELPNLVDQFLTSWAWKVKKPEFRSATQRLDAGFTFRQVVPVGWMVSTTKIDDDQLEQT